MEFGFEAAFRSPLKRGLFVRRFFGNAILVLLNKIVRRNKKSGKIPVKPQKILLSNIGSFGDVVISTAILPILKKNFPDCEIGFLVSSSSAEILKKHPLITRIHRFDHWYAHRYLGLCKALLHHWRSRRNCLRELAQVKYDAAIDSYSYFPNSILLLAKSLIPVLIGYTTGGWGGVLTHPVEWKFPDRYVGYAQLHLLTVLGVKVEKESPLPFYGDVKYASAPEKKSKQMIVVHMGSFDPLKEWDREKWVELILYLEARGDSVVLTGKGEREALLCGYVAQKTSAQNLSNQLDWFAFVRLIQNASLLISVDSVAVHIAAAASVPTVGIFSGINSPKMWMPDVSTYVGMMKQVPCAPCFNKKGCSTMACIQKVEVGEVYRNVLKIRGLG